MADPPARRPLRPNVSLPTLGDQYLPFKWRDVEVPTTRIRVSVSHDIVEHKNIGVDGEDLEATGRNSFEIEAEIPFINDLAAGKSENWAKDGNLYPDIFRKFFYAWLDRSTGPLQHPEFGIIQCKPHRIDFDHDGQARNGVFVKAVWLQTRDEDGNDIADIIAIKGSPIAMVRQAALDLDASTKDIRGLFDGYLPPKFEETFDSAVAKLAGNFDRISTSIDLAANKPAQIMKRLDQLERSVNRLRSSATWPINDAAARMREGLLGLASLAGADTGKKIGRYTTTAATTIARLAIQLKNTSGDLTRLNPNLISRPEIGAGVAVRYYV